jgi:Protein of unknown function (DUF2905)
MGKILVVFGLLVVVVGVVLMFSDKIPFLGKLPGDITIKRENFEFHFPITTSIVISAILSTVLWLISHFKGK